MKTRNLIIIGVSALLVASFALLFTYLRGYMPKYQWNENYSILSDQPYGLKYFYRLLDKSAKVVDVKKGLRQTISPEDEDACYIFVGNNLMLNMADQIALKDFVYEGNSAFISVKHGDTGYREDTSFVYEFLTGNQYLPNLIQSHEIDTAIYINDKGEEDSLRFNYQNLKVIDTTYKWHSINNKLLQGKFISESISSFSGNTNCLKVKHGEGYFYFHTNPLLFTNYHMLRDEGFAHASHVLPIDPETTVYWDRVRSTQAVEEENLRPLSFIFKQPALKWAWYIGVTMVILYLLFFIKRKQKPIALLKEKRNSSQEYAKAIGALYFHKGDHKIIVNELMRLFYVFLRNKYGLTKLKSEKDSQKRTEQIARFSDVSEALIEKIFMLERKMLYGDASVENLNDLYNSLNRFYTQCK